MSVRHRFVRVDRAEVFYREAGRPDAPTVLLLHGFPSSSIQFRYMLSDLADEWHLVAPDLPGFGFTRPDLGYVFSFDGLAATVAAFVRTLQLDVRAAYLHDYGAQVGFRLLTRAVIQPRAIVIQNSEAYRDIGWLAPMRAIEKRDRRTLLAGLLNPDGIRREFVEELPADLAERIDPAIIALGIHMINEAAMLDLHMDYGSNIEHYPKMQAYVRESAARILVLWGERDQYVSADGARAYGRDVRLFDGGHWLLETHPTEVNVAVRQFLAGE